MIFQKQKKSEKEEEGRKYNIDKKMESREQFFRYIMFPFYDQSCLGLNSCELEDLCSPEANYPTFTRNLCIGGNNRCTNYTFISRR